MCKSRTEVAYLACAQYYKLIRFKMLNPFVWRKSDFIFSFGHPALRPTTQPPTHPYTLQALKLNSMLYLFHMCTYKCVSVLKLCNYKTYVINFRAISGKTRNWKRKLDFSFWNFQGKKRYHHNSSYKSFIWYFSVNSNSFVRSFFFSNKSRKRKSIALNRVVQLEFYLEAKIKIEKVRHTAKLKSSIGTLWLHERVCVINFSPILFNRKRTRNLFIRWQTSYPANRAIFPLFHSLLNQNCKYMYRLMDSNWVCVFNVYGLNFKKNFMHWLWMWTRAYRKILDTNHFRKEF